MRGLPPLKGACPPPWRDPNPLGHGARLMPVEGDSMAPTLRPGDVLLMVPVGGYHCEGIYALSLDDGHPNLYRCEARQGAIRVAKDNAAYAPFTLTREAFADAVLGQAAMHGRILAAGLLPGGAS